MKISYNWLRQYLPLDITPQKLGEILTNIGLEVAEIVTKESVPGGLKGLVVGEVESCEPHSNADRLRVTTVRINKEEVLSIVCGATNVISGQKVIVATVGTTLFPKDGSPFKIKKAKIRGEISEGMICAEDEIGLGESHEGIMVLPEDTPIGMTAASYFNLEEPEIIIEIDLTPNRSDANSHLGVAKDLCAYFSYHDKKEQKLISPDFQESLQPNSAEDTLPLEVKIENLVACPRFAGIVLKNIRVQASPEWLQKRLLSIDVQPINNVVDVTNFVLNEYGQPIHAYDYDKIEGKQIIIKNLKTGTPFKTLDGEEKKLSEEDLMICDGNGNPMCMAGVYGGMDSGITKDTRNIFIESAYFHPKIIRRSSIRHDLRTEAATHFEKGVAMAKILPALKRAVSLILEMTEASVAHEIIDNYPKPKPDKHITLNYAYLERICGKRFEPSAVKILFKSLGLTLVSENENSLVVAVPEENPDIHQPADLAEEVLRIDGLNNIPIPEKLSYILNPGTNNLSLRNLKERMASFLAYSGLQEIITNSITNSKYYPDQDNLVRLINSLSSELDVLRPDMLESGLEVIAYNRNRKTNDVHLFEFGKTYSDNGNHNYEQTEWLSIWSSGNIRPQQWSHKEESTDFYVLKGILTSLFSLSGLENVREVNEDNQLIWKNKKQTIAILKSVPDTLRNLFGIKEDVFYAAVHLANLYEAVKNNTITHADTPKFPAMKRDLALIIPKEVGYEKVAAIAQKQNWEALRDFELFDIFEHQKIGEDNKSMALSFTFQLKDRTLTDKEVDEMMNTLMKDYRESLKATIRS